VPGSAAFAITAFETLSLLEGLPADTKIPRMIQVLLNSKIKVVISENDEVGGNDSTVNMQTLGSSSVVIRWTGQPTTSAIDPTMPDLSVHTPGAVLAHELFHAMDFIMGTTEEGRQHYFCGVRVVGAFHDVDHYPMLCIGMELVPLKHVPACQMWFELAACDFENWVYRWRAALPTIYNFPSTGTPPQRLSYSEFRASEADDFGRPRSDKLPGAVLAPHAVPAPFVH